MRSVTAVCLAFAVSATLVAQSGVASRRVYGSATNGLVGIETLLADVARADVLFVGEQHDNIDTHNIELALLEGLARQPRRVVLALEMFERDVQEPLAHFLMGHSTEPEFLAASRPWPQYARDYKPLVDFAIARKWDVVASNVPRAIAADVSRSGLGSLKSRPESEQAWFARDLECPTSGRYFRRFRDLLGGQSHSPQANTSALDAATIERYYLSQCLKDETMAESIAQAYAAGAAGGSPPLVVSINGSFHSDFGDGTVERVRRRLPGKRVSLVTILAVPDPVRFAPNDEDRRRGDYLIFTAVNPG